MASTRTEAPGIPFWGLVVASLAVGVVAGAGAVVFRALIALFHNLLFLGTLSLQYDADVHTPASPWGPWLTLVPVLGAFGVAFLVKTFAPEAKGHGVPEVMDAIWYNDGRIRPIVAVVKSLASALAGSHFKPRMLTGASLSDVGPLVPARRLGRWLG